MTVTARPSARRRVPATVGRGVFVRFPIALVMAELSAIFLVAGVVDLADDADVTVAFLVAGVACGAWAGVELGRVARPSVTSAPAVMTMATVAWCTLIAGSAVAHLLADATDDVDAAVFEGAAVATTTAMTGLDADALPMGLHMHRALTQWASGLGALIMVLVVTPLVFGRRLPAPADRNAEGVRALITARTRGTRNVLAIYSTFTAAMVVAYLAAGMGLFDGVVHALATVSTGGLGTRSGSLAAFDSAAIEWVATAGMIVAGTGYGIIWWVIHRRRRPLARSSELRSYLVVMSLSFVAIAVWLGDDIGTAATRTAAFTVASAMSTTGFTSTDWSMFAAGAQTLVLALIGVGAMSRSAGGGFRHLHVIQAFRFAGRELKRQLHPSAVGVVRVDGEAVDERTLERLTAYVIVIILVVAAGGMAIELGDSQVTPDAAISLSISAVSTAGPQVTDPVALDELGSVSKLAIATLMLLGRLSIYAVVLTVVNAAARVSSAVSMRVARSPWADR